jgi:signal transduction histidine kinase
MKRDPLHLIDATVPLWTGAIIAGGLLYRSDGDAWLLALGLPAALVLFLRRRAPGLTLAISGALALALIMVDPVAGAIGVLAPAVALYSFALDRGRAHLIVATIVAVAAVVLAETVLAREGLTLQTLAHMALVAVPLLAAEAVRSHRDNVRLLIERAELAERTREEEAQRRVEQERLRIARELHDVVAHTITTINVQAGVAAYLLDRDPSHARQALGIIEAASHDALDEMRTVLGVLRDGEGDHAPLEPAPRLTDIDELLRQAREGGLRATLEVVGGEEDAAAVPDAVQLAAFRIVQESLTNVRRHAPHGAARVIIRHQSDLLSLAVENDMVAGRHDDGGGGAGILGMRERATALGGKLEAGPLDGRFRVAAELPYHRAS